MTTHDAHSCTTYRPRLETLWAIETGSDFRVAGSAGFISDIGNPLRFHHPRPPVGDVYTCHVGECLPWVCPHCRHDALIYSVTEDGFDWLFCPGCTDWHRKPIAMGVDESVCHDCGVGVSALEFRHGADRAWVCAFCVDAEAAR